MGPLALECFLRGGNVESSKGPRLNYGRPETFDPNQGYPFDEQFHYRIPEAMEEGIQVTKENIDEEDLI